jgi:hypothetical protein
MPDRNALLHAWAMLLLRNAVSMNTWHIVGLLTAAGSFRSAASAMREACAIMHCSVLAQACVRLGLTERVSSAPRNNSAGADADTKPNGSAATLSASLKCNSGTVFVEPPSAMRERSSLNASDLLAQPGVMQATPSDSECAEAGSDMAASPSRLECLPAPELSPSHPQKSENVVSDTPVALLGASAENQTEALARELEVLANLHAPVAAVQARGAAAEGGLGRMASGEMAGSGSLPHGSLLGGTMEVISELDDLASIRVAVRRHTIDVLSEAMASEAWM